MEKVKVTDEYTVVKKRSGRYGVKDANGKWLNGEDKVKILLAEGLIKVSAPTKKEEAPEVEETAAPSESSEEAPAGA